MTQSLTNNFSFLSFCLSSSGEMSTTGSSLNCEGMYSQLIDNESCHDDLPHRPDVEHRGKQLNFNPAAVPLWGNADGFVYLCFKTTDFVLLL